MTTRGGTLLVVGGGRWARVYLSVIGKTDIPMSKVAVVSRHGGDIAAAFKKSNGRGRAFAQYTGLDEALAAEDVSAAVVVNAARAHARTTLPLLERKIPVLLEKPVALSGYEAELMIAASKTADVRLMPALVLRFCDYLRTFERAVCESLDDIASISVRWSDPAAEVRHGETKGIDAGIGVVEEIAPHIASLLSAVIGGSSHRVDRAEFARGGLSVMLKGQWNGAALDVSLERQSARRERVVVVCDHKGREARLDFSTEPGVMTAASASRSADPDWSGRPSPLTRQLLDFIATCRGPAIEADRDAVRYSTAFTTRAASLVRDAQKQWLHSADLAAAGPQDRQIAAREVLAPWLTEAGLVAPGDNGGLVELSREIMVAVEGGAAANLSLALQDIVRRAGI